jgi:hypothetical protein
MTSWFREQLASNDLAATDVSGWDWSVQGFELDADFELRTQLCNGEGSIWERIARVRFQCIKRKTFLLPDGSLIAQLDEGIMASGWYNTSSSNSRIRIVARALSYSLYCERLNVDFVPEECTKVAAMGDDCVESALDDACYDILAELGHTVKEIEFHDKLEGLEFCSHRWYDDGLARPVNWVKSLFRFANHPVDPDQQPGWALQLMADFRHMRGVGDREIQAAIAAATEAVAKLIK